MPMTFYAPRYFLNQKTQWIILLLSVVFSSLVNAATYNLTSGSYPPCNTSWSVSGTTYTCNGNGRVTLAAGDILTANTTITISANNGFSLNNNTIGSSSNRINLTSTYGSHDASATTTIWGNLTSSGAITLVGTTVNGTVTTSGDINLTGGGVTGLVRSNNNTITTNGTNLSGGATAQSGMSITGGTLAGNFVMTSNNVMTLSGVVMTSGSISGASTVTIQNGSVLGSGSSSITISSNSGAITVNNSIVYGSLTAPNYSTVNVTNGGAVYGTCSPGSTPANACGSTPPSPMNCPAGVSSGITGNYYNNRTLTEPSAATRSDAPIDFNWGAAAPGPSGINADNFSTRWTGYVRVTQSGSYRFQTVSDDGVRLYVNGNLVIDRWNDHSAATDTTVDIPLVAGSAYTLVLEYYEAGGDAVIRLNWRLPGASSYVAIPGGPLPTMGAGLYECAPVTTPPVASCPTTLTAGITGDYFNNQSLTAPVTSRRSDGPINFDWGTGAPGPTGIGANTFSVRWDGYVRVTQSGVHRFQTNSDDGVRLTVNGVLLIDQWNDHSVTTHTSGAVNLIAGNTYPIKLEYYENGGFAVAQLRWQTPGSGSYVDIPRGTGSSPISAAGLYECVSTPGSYLITHNATGITCAAEAVTVSARNTANVVYNPPAGTVVTLSTDPATGVWVGGNTFTFTGNESSFTKYLRQTTPGLLTINASSPTAPNNSSDITFVNTALRIALNSALADIPTQVAGVNGNAIAKVISTNPKTGVCEAIVASRTLQTGLGFTCNNPTTCANGQTFAVNGVLIAANINAASVTYNNVNLTFNASGEAPMTINYFDVGQVTLHGRLKIDESGNNPELILSASSNPFVVKPYTLAVTGVVQTASPYSVNPGTTNTGNGFIPAGEKFMVSVQSRNALGAITPNFGNELTTSERNKIQLQMGCPERDEVSDPACTTIKPDYPTGGGVGNLVIGEDNNSDTIIDPYGALSAGAIIPGVWNEVGSFRLEPSLSGAGYLGQGNVPYITPSGVIGRFYPDQYTLADTDLIKTCSIVDVPPVIPQRQFHYMGKIFNADDNDPNTKGLVFKLRAVNKQGNTVSNYDSTKTYNTAAVDFYTFSGSTDYSTRLVNNVGAILTPGAWVNGVIDINHSSAQFGRAATPDGPYANITIGIGVKDCLDKRFLLGRNLTLDTTANCGAPTDNGYKLTTFDARYGRLRLDDAFGPETANLPVNFATEFWVGSFFVPNMNDSCTKILRSAISYPAGNILAPANLTVQLNGGTTAGVYGSTTAVEINFTSGSGQHSFSAPSGNAQGEFNVDVDLTNYPWLRFDWNQDANYSDTSLPTARFGFGSYRGHDRVIYWRERF
jgi:MSHA biogenesis protein MshQ